MIRHFDIADIPSVMNLLDRCRPYVLAHHEYVYWMLSRYHSTTSFVFEEEDKIIGFLGTLQSIETSSVFIWQICVDPDHRKKGIAFKMLEELETLLRNHTIQNIQLSITDGNSASFDLFERFSKQRNLTFAQTDSLEISGNCENVYIIKE